MSREKIEEMTVEFAKINCNPKGCYSCDLCDEYGSLELNCEDYLYYRTMAETFYNAGYRKQSDNTIELPCKVGDAVYYVDKGRMKEATVGEITVGRNNTWIIILEFVCEEDCDGCPFESWSQEYSGEWSCGGGWGTWNVDKGDFGKTVFLTKAEAEAKMKVGAE